jgi:hypothetical protein
MGEPKQITVRIEPGDTLNEYPGAPAPRLAPTRFVG